MGTPFTIESFGERPPFSFVYDGAPSAELLAQWSPSQRSSAVAGGREHVLTWEAPDGFQVVATVLMYTEHSVVEWGVELVAPIRAVSKRLTRVLAIDTALTGEGPAVVHTNDGSSAEQKDFRPITDPLVADRQPLLYSSCGGRSSSQYEGSLAGIPYVNIDRGGHGHVVALGWPGQWGMQIGLDDGGGAVLQGGMTSLDGLFTGALPTAGTIEDLGLADLYLEAGERIQTPSVVTMGWSGADWIDGQNQWRRWMLEHNTPRYGGEPPAPIGAATQADTAFMLANAELQIGVWDEYHRNGVTGSSGGGLDWLWIDAGWYQAPEGVDRTTADSWTWTGNHWPDPARYPNGILEVTDAVRAKGGKTILWLEIERCRPGTWLADNHPEWLLTPEDPEWLYLNWGDPEAFEWALATTSTLIEEQKFELLRIDFNWMGPLVSWNLTDPEDRQGITQAKWCAGFIAWLDALREAYPDLLIESCASGGRRLDVATMRRCVSMTKTDKFRDSVASQGSQYGLSSWLICHGNAADAYSTYGIRSAMAWHLEAHLDGVARRAPAGVQWEQLDRGYRDWASVNASYLGDFYPLTDYTLELTDWIGYQYHRRDLRQGVVQMYAREQSTGTAAAVLRGLLADASYEVTDLDDPGSAVEMSGASLMIEGITVTPPERPYAALLSYRQL